MEEDLGAQSLGSRPPGAAALDSDIETSNRLYEAATREWRALAESLHDLKKALEPADFTAALTHLRIPDLGSLVHEWRRAQANYEEALGSASACQVSAARDAESSSSGEKPATSAFDPARGAREPTTDGGAMPPPGADTTARTPATQETVSSSSAQDGPDTTGIQEQLAELTNLLRQHVALASDQDPSSRMEIPRQLTLNIAREVAGRVKDSVLETLRESGVNVTRRGRRSLETADRESGAKSEQIPLEDVAAMIDQLTNPAARGRMTSR